MKWRLKLNERSIKQTKKERLMKPEWNGMKENIQSSEIKTFNKSFDLWNLVD